MRVEGGRIDSGEVCQQMSEYFRLGILKATPSNIAPKGDKPGFSNRGLKRVKEGRQWAIE